MRRRGRIQNMKTSNCRYTDQLAVASMISLHDKKVKVKGQGYSKVKTNLTSSMFVVNVSFLAIGEVVTPLKVTLRYKLNLLI